MGNIVILEKILLSSKVDDTSWKQVNINGQNQVTLTSKGKYLKKYFKVIFFYTQIHYLNIHTFYSTWHTWGKSIVWSWLWVKLTFIHYIFVTLRKEDIYSTHKTSLLISSNSRSVCGNSSTAMVDWWPVLAMWLFHLHCYRSAWGTARIFSFSKLHVLCGGPLACHAWMHSCVTISLIDVLVF